MADQSGYHCGNVTHNSSECVACFFPQNCLRNNSCLQGTEGPTCEKCVKGFYRIGCVCFNCPLIPWTSVGLGFIILLFFGYIVYKGFTVSLYTKMKLLCHFLQILILTLSISISWPPSLMLAFSQLTFLNWDSRMFEPECYISLPFPSYYLEWLAVMILPFVFLVVISLVDKALQQQIKYAASDEKLDLWVNRSSTRRVCTWLVVLFYAPVTGVCVRTFVCSGNVPMKLTLGTSDLYLYDQSQRCDDFIFQTFNFLALLLLVFFTMFCPILIIFWTLRLKKWNLLDCKTALHGSAYESYKRRFCFWESLPMLRKLTIILTTDVYPILPMLQIGINLTITFVYTLLVILGRPYRKYMWKKTKVNIHNTFEVFANISIACLQALALLQVFGIENVAIEYGVIGLTGLSLLMWLAMLLMTPFEEVLEETFELPMEKIPSEPTTFWRRNRVGEGITNMELEEREKALNF